MENTDNRELFPDPNDTVKVHDILGSEFSGTIDSVIERLAAIKKSYPDARLEHDYYKGIHCSCYYECDCPERALMLVYSRPRYFFERNR